MLLSEDEEGDAAAGGAEASFFGIVFSFFDEIVCRRNHFRRKKKTSNLLSPRSLASEMVSASIAPQLAAIGISLRRARSEWEKARSRGSARRERRRCRNDGDDSLTSSSLFSLKNLSKPYSFQTTPVAVGVAVGAAAYAAKFAIEAFVRIRSMPKSRNFYKGGFLPEMTRREAALILGLREGAQEARVRDAHRRIMIANHPDAGGSSYLATKVNEAKEMLMGGKGKRSGGGSAF